MKIITVFFCILALAVSRTYPLFKQCDQKWRDQQLGTSSNTICSAGCLMSSASMALNAIGQNYNPSSLNTWLKGHGGYVNGDLFVWASINSLGVTFLGKVSRSQIKQNLAKDNIVILNVHNGGHWVLATGINGDSVSVNDPGYSTTAYTMDQIVQNQVGVYRVGNGSPLFFINQLEAAIHSIVSEKNLKQQQDVVGAAIRSVVSENLKQQQDVVEAAIRSVVSESLKKQQDLVIE